MPLLIGTRLGPYEIVAPLGAGGMGEVYRARDTKLDRDVAVKVLPAGMSSDPERRARFEREAKVVAALSHPNILAIFDFGVDSPPAGPAVAYAVMELLHGETLRARLDGGGLPVRKATEIAVQILSGLAAAHDKGLVHRDLKPENVFLLSDGQVKILDFGLAKAFDVASGGARSGPGSAPNAETILATDAGAVMGTVGYMAPEQVRGQALDARSDLFSVGAVLYEMLAGQRAFRRETSAETMTAILKEDPQELLVARADLPASLDRIVRHCLEKNPAERFQTARDVRFALEALSGSGSSRVPAVETSAPRRRAIGPLALVGAIAFTGVGLVAGWLLRAPAPPVVRTLDVAAEGLDVLIDHVPIVSPDGRRMLYSAAGRLWVRELDRFDASELAGTEDAIYFSWAPDSRSLAYVQAGRLVRMPIEGGKGVALGTVPSDMGGSGGTLWMADGRILLIGSDTHGLSEISDRGGDLKDVALLDPKQEVDFHELSALPDRRGVLMTVHRMATQRADTIEAFVDGKRRVVLQLPGESLRQPVYSPTGHLIYQRETTNPGVWAVRFSAASLTTAGDPFLVVPTGSWPSVGAGDTLAIVRPSSARPDLVWVDRSGVTTPVATLPHSVAFAQRGFRDIAISPDGKRAVVGLGVAAGTELWVYDFARKSIDQVTHGGGMAVFPEWMPDGRTIVFSSFQGGRAWSLFTTPASGGPVRRLTDAHGKAQAMGSVAPDGRSIAFDSGADLFVLPLDAAGAPGPTVQMTATPASELGPRIAPDGHWVAYMSNQTGRFEVYVRALPSGSDPRQVSSSGGTMPIWSRDGRELLYRSGESVMAASVSAGPNGFESAPARLLFSVPRAVGLFEGFDVAADGRLLMLRSPSHDRMTIILNWPEALKRIETSGAGGR